MGCFPSPNKEVTQWNNFIKSRKTTDDDLKAVVKEIILQKKSRNEVSGRKQEQLIHYLLKTSSSQQKLITIISNLNLPLIKFEEIFPEYKLNKKIARLENEIENLTRGNSSHRGEIPAQPSGKHQTKLNRTQPPVSENQEVGGNRVSVKAQVNYVNEALETEYERKQQQCEEILKAQHYLIADLRNRLVLCENERDNLKASNSALEIELQELRQINLQKFQLEEELEQKRDVIQCFSEISDRRNQQIQEYEVKVVNLNNLLLQQRLTFDQQQQLREKALHDHNLHFEKLRNENESLVQQVAKLEANYENANHTFAEDFKRMERLVDQLKHLLSESNRVRDFLKTQNDHLHQEVQDLKRQIGSVTPQLGAINADLNDFSSSSNNNKRQGRLEQDGAEEVAVEDQTNENTKEDVYVRKALDKIKGFGKDIDNVAKGVETFSGSKEDKTFLQLKETLILTVLKLDNIDTEGHSIIRQERKEVIQRAHELLDFLNSKCS